MLKDNGKQLNKKDINILVFAKRLNKLRKDSNLSRKELYKAMDELNSKDYRDNLIGYQNALNNGSKNTIWNYEKGRSLPTVAKIKKLASIFKLTPWELIFGDISEYIKGKIENIDFVYIEHNSNSKNNSKEYLVYKNLDQLFSYVVDGYRPRLNRIHELGSYDHLLFETDPVTNNKNRWKEWNRALEIFFKHSSFQLIIKELKANFDFYNIENVDLENYILPKLISAISSVLNLTNQLSECLPITFRLDCLINRTIYNTNTDLPTQNDIFAFLNGGQSENLKLWEYNQKIAAKYSDFINYSNEYFKKLKNIQKDYRELVLEKDNS
ncbi:hypothetical protein ATX59_09380 [Oenococcus oeni]|uniref:HTH cro/C1-type domain-containing protein n=1 Tax=Oenococcus oeni TaxID=1247 RepID=A0A6N4A495_OENOE|nr:helix-turn-helix transcriptional regulator [Oenococcus oeni]OIM20340.1 hypothetical protein ATX59_09380 [Oenococcus oeni]